MKVESLQELFVEELCDLYDAEHQILDALPKMIRSAHHAELRQTLQDHLEVTRRQVERLERVFEEVGAKPSRKSCPGVRGIIQEAQRLIDGGGEPDTVDAGLIAEAQKVEHYEIAGYGTVRTWASELGEQEACRLLQETLDEEGEADRALTRLAQQRVNVHAVAHSRQAA